MKKFCGSRINVTKYDFTFATKGGSNSRLSSPLPCGYTTEITNISFRSEKIVEFSSYIDHDRIVIGPRIYSEPENVTPYWTLTRILFDAYKKTQN